MEKTQNMVQRRSGAFRAATLLQASCELFEPTKIADCKGQLRGSAAAHKQLATLGNE